MPRHPQQSVPDPVYQVVELLGDGWSWLILRNALFNGVTRFNDFQQRLGIARKVLSQRLDSLTEGGLFRREDTREGGGGHLEYVLTEMGRDFFTCLVAAMFWGERWYDEKEALQPKLIHRTRGHRLKPVFCCSECGQALRAREVAVVGIHRASADLIAAKRRRAANFDLVPPSEPRSLVRTLRVFGDRWSGLLIRECFLRTRRFRDFQEHLGIAPNILASRLERLVDLGVLTTQPSVDQPGWHEYRLTEKGLDLYSIPLAMLTWAEKWLSAKSARTHLRHKLCGKRFSAILSCASCSERLQAEDIVAAAAPPAARNHRQQA
ncbi:winged helix-turn-helix transcriptional regulator [Bradyrhizobium sp. DASA03007]|uniref:winged helix-turn-helix transcriptional regulator n=1 Tax=unclassified Bradyrhizobium TaxID=2631580 RepID=UPI003F72F093